MTNTTNTNSKYTFNTTRTMIFDGEETSGTGVRSYSYKPTPHFMGGNPETALMYVVELEVDRFPEDVYPDNYAAWVHGNMGERFYCKHDGSLDDGVEVVSHPATLAYHMRKMGWADVLGGASDVGAQSHDCETCGLHVHVGRAALGNTDDARELCIAKLLILTERFYDNELLNFSRRGRFEMQRWAKKTTAGVVAGDKRDTVLGKAKNANANHDRYTALNLTNYATIEFRIFRGTLNPQTFAATLQLVDCMVRWCKQHTLQEVIGCTFADIVKTCKYPELAAYCIRRRIAINTEVAA